MYDANFSQSIKITKSPYQRKNVTWLFYGNKTIGSTRLIFNYRLEYNIIFMGLLNTFTINIYNSWPMLLMYFQLRNIYVLVCYNLLRLVLCKDLQLTSILLWMVFNLFLLIDLYSTTLEIVKVVLKSPKLLKQNLTLIIKLLIYDIA